MWQLIKSMLKHFNMKVSHVFLYFCTMHSVAYVPVVLHFVCLPVPAEISACVNELSALIRYSKHPSEGHERVSEILHSLCTGASQ